VDLYVTQGLCLTNFATYSSPPADYPYPYASENPGVEHECLTVGTNSLPLPLAAGEWYVAVVNRSVAPVSYCFLATNYETNPAVRLAGGAPVCGQTVATTNATGGIGVNYYVFNVASNALQASFETLAATGNVDLYLQHGFCFSDRDTFPLTATNAPYASTNAGLADEFICVDETSLPVALRPGDWYLAVVNREAVDVDFCVEVQQLLDTAILGLTNGLGYMPPALLAAAGVDYYRYEVSPDAVQVNVEVLQPTGNADLYVTRGFCSSNVTDFIYSSTSAGAADELVSISTNSMPLALQEGGLFIAVENSDVAPVDYTVRVTEVLASDIIRLTNAVPFGNTVVALGSLTGFPENYYVFNVATGAVRAQFEVLLPDGNVDLAVRKGFPLPTLANTSLSSTNAGSGDELVLVFNDSVPVPLTPGDWYLSVLNRTLLPVTYTVMATQFGQPGTNVTTTSFVVITNSFCVTWTNTIPGVNYHVRGTAQLVPQIWFPVSPTIRADSTSLTWCTPLPTPYQFFELFEGLSQLSAGTPVAFTTMSGGPGGLVLEWTAEPGLQFGVQWTDGISPPMWQPYPLVITSVTGTYTFTDDGSLTGGLNPARFYRVFLLP
jgi:hypothetical protein